MRPHLCVLALLAFALVAAVAPVQARPLPNNLILIDPSAEPPPDLLEVDEVERIMRLQREAVYATPFSPVSPDEQVVLVTSNEQLSLLDIRDGSARSITPEALGSYIPLPLAGFSQFTWLDAATLGSLAVDTGAIDPDQALVRLRIDRYSLAVTAEPLTLPPDTGLVSVAPDLRHLLLAILPSGEEPLPTPAAHPRPGITWPEQPAAPPALRRRIAEARARQAPSFARLRLMQEGAITATVPDLPEMIDLVLYTAGEPGYRYVTSISAAAARLGDAWAPDSSRLAISFHGLPDAQSDRPRFDGALLSEEVYQDVTGNLPPALNPILQENSTYLIDVRSGTAQILRPDGEVAPPLLSAEAWSPDGAILLVKALHPARLRGRTHPIYTPQFTERAAFRFYDGALRELGRLESDRFSSGAWSSVEASFLSPDELLIRTNTGTDRRPYYYNRVSGELRDLADRAGAYYNVVSAGGSRQLIFTFTSFTEPPDIYRMGWDGKGLVRLTWAGEELRQLAGLRQDPVHFTLAGGQVRSGVLIQPASAPFPPRKARIVAWQEGGPGPAMTNRWEASVERPFALLPGLGLALLVTPVAGRAGYTPAIFNRLADGANFGQVDIDEQAAIARELIRRGWASPGGLGITGCSYGGYFALQSLVRHPTLYAAANPQCAMVDVITEWTRGFAGLAPYLEGLPPYSNPDEYRRDSPVYNAGQIRAAVLTFHGSEDYLPVVQNENLHLQLVGRGLPARMVTFLGEGHGLTDEANELYAAQEQVHWFRTYLR